MKQINDIENHTTEGKCNFNIKVVKFSLIKKVKLKTNLSNKNSEKRGND